MQRAILLFYPLVVFLSFIYYLVIKLLLFLYKAKILKTHTISSRTKIISIGNIAVGGTGKTSVTIYLANKFIENNKRVVILHSGYTLEKKNILFSSDEVVLLKKRIHGVHVHTDKDKLRGCRVICNTYNPDVIILDDGFQCYKIKKDVEIVCISATDYLWKERIFPWGSLREPVGGLSRADVLMLTFIDLVEENVKEKWLQFFNRNFPNIPLILCRCKIASVYEIFDKKSIDVEILKAAPVVLVSALGNNDNFRLTCEHLGLNIFCHYKYPDHYEYKVEDIEKIISHKYLVLTTEKDEIKLRRIILEKLEVPIYVVRLELDILNQDVWEKVFSQILDKIK
jgi:tetraacyldisaccharide 4'-kinase